MSLSIDMHLACRYCACILDYAVSDAHTRKLRCESVGTALDVTIASVGAPTHSERLRTALCLCSRPHSRAPTASLVYCIAIGGVHPYSVGGTKPEKTCHFFSGPRAVPPHFCRRPSMPPGPGPSHGALPAPWDGPGAASRAVRLQLLGGTPGRTFAATLAA